jgi:catalase-peroxidase
MGPKSRYKGYDFPKEDFIWQDPIPEGRELEYPEIESVKSRILDSEISLKEMIETAWASASTFRGSDYRGGGNGARIRLEPQINWEANKPEQLKRVLRVYGKLSQDLNVSIADLIVLGGAAAIEKISKDTNHEVSVSVKTGRGDATDEQTDAESFNVLEPVADGFRNYIQKEYAVSPEEMMLDKAQLLGLDPVEMTVLVGGMRSLGISYTNDGVWGDTPTLDNSWFKTLLSMDVEWKEVGFNKYQAYDRRTGEKVRTATRCDLVFGSNSELRAIVEVYAQDDNKSKLLNDFISVWKKVMNADI